MLTPLQKAKDEDSAYDELFTKSNTLSAVDAEEPVTHPITSVDPSLYQERTF